MNRYPFWKNLLIALVVALGVLYALPNLYGKKPAVQLNALNGPLAVDTTERALATLENAELTPQRFDLDAERLVLQFDNLDAQRKASDVLKAELGQRYSISLNLVPATPDWLRSFASPMALGLDLRGGVHFLMQVDMEAAIDTRVESLRQDLRTGLRERDIKYRGVVRDGHELRIRFSDEASRDAASAAISRQYLELQLTRTEQGDDLFLVANLTENAILEERDSALQQNIITLRNRVNALGVAEPVIQRQGNDRIVVQLPGVQDPERAREILGSTATLEYRLVYGSANDWFSAEATGRAPANAQLFSQRDDGSPILLRRDVIATGDQITNASAGIDSQSGSPAVFVDLDSKGARRMQRITAENIGNLMAVVFIETRTTTTMVDGEVQRERNETQEVINTATIRDVLSNRFQTTGLASQEARDLALLLRAGALRAPVEIIEERTVGPSLGEDNIEQGLMSVLVGFGFVLLFMALYYKVFGLIANLALALNLVLLVAALSLLQATLTLPGIAGIVLTVGMAVDANVLIFERIKEELRNGAAVAGAINAGYEKAVITIADANITTLIAALVLFGFGTGPIKGFAITLSFGIVTSMFTAIWGTRALVNWLYGSKRLERLPI